MLKKHLANPDTSWTRIEEGEVPDASKEADIVCPKYLISCFEFHDRCNKQP